MGIMATKKWLQSYPEVKFRLFRDQNIVVRHSYKLETLDTQKIASRTVGFVLSLTQNLLQIK